MRAFVAIELPPGIRGTISRTVDDIRRRLPPARWVRAEGYHLTLLFLGDIEAATAAVLEQALAPVFESRRPLTLQLANGGTFPPGRPARVAWLGLEDPGPVSELAAAVRERCSEVAGHRDERAFSPHLTIARCRSPWPKKAVEEWRRSSQGKLGEPFSVTRGVLMRSHLGRSGAHYEVVAAFPLGT